MTHIPLIYLAGPYTGKDSQARWRNCQQAVDYAMTVVKLGCYPVASHHLGLYVQDGGGRDEQWWYEATLGLMLRCDAVLLLPRWDLSLGTLDEHDTASARNMPIFYEIDDLTAWIRDLKNNR